MRIVSSIAAMHQLAATAKRRGAKIAFVPTMGYLHAGHLSLIRRARQLVGRKGVVVASIYVNPTQFAPNEDLSSYPRDLPRDQRLCREAGVDFLFLPTDKMIYPGRNRGEFSTYVVEENLSKVMEGASRPNHFRGVTTVVAKLFHMVAPDVAVFGAKDFQQAAIIERMVKDLNFPVRIVVAPTVREPDGLALSSRNKYLEGDLRLQARALWQSIEKARQLIRSTRRPLRAASLKEKLQDFIESHAAARVDYIEFFDAATLQPVPLVARRSHMALAVIIGKTRLIDNARL